MFKKRDLLEPEFKETPEFNDLIITTSTLYPKGGDRVVSARRQLALEFFRKAKELGIKCVVNDGGSDEKFLEELKALENVDVLVDPNLSLGESTREAMGRAASHSEISFFMSTVSEKTDLLNRETLGKLISQLRSGQADIVVANRENLASRDSPVSKSMTELQRSFELRANKRASGVIYGKQNQAELDLLFGVNIMNRQGLQYFLDYRSKIDKWDAVVTPIINAYRGGKRVIGVDVPYVYESVQTQSEENNPEMDKKRWAQYRKILGVLGDPFWARKLEDK